MPNAHQVSVQMKHILFFIMSFFAHSHTSVNYWDESLSTVNQSQPTLNFTFWNNLSCFAFHTQFLKLLNKKIIIIINNDSLHQTWQHHMMTCQSKIHSLFHSVCLLPNVRIFCRFSIVSDQIKALNHITITIVIIIIIDVTVVVCWFSPLFNRNM